MKNIAATCICLFLLIDGTRSQELMTLEQAVSIGLTNNFGILISQNTLREAQNNATRGNAGMLPKVSVNAGYTKGLSDARVKVYTGNELDISNAPSDLLTGGVGLNWRLFDGLNMFITFDKLKKLEEKSDLSAKITVETTVAGIIAGYYEIVRQGRMREMLLEQVEISKFRTDLAKMCFETGAGSEMEYLKSRVELNADLASLSNQKTLYENSKTNLNDLLSRDIMTGFTVADTISLSDMLNYDTLLTSLKSTNHNLMLAAKDKQIGELSVKSAQSVQWPTLDYFAGFNYFRNETEANFIQYNRNYGPTMGLTLNMKLFDGLNQKRQYRNAVISQQSYELGFKQTESRLMTCLTGIFNEYRNQHEMIGFEQENLQLAIKNMELAKESYAVGSISSLQLREVQEDLLSARNRLITAQFVAKLTETELLLLSGRLVN
jgi:outer membrane protein TolC